MGLKEWLFGEDPSDLNEEALAATWHAANEMWAYNWALSQDNYAYQQENTAAARINETSSRNFKEQSEYNGWLNRENMRLFEYSKQVEAYNASVSSYEEQIDYNNLAQEIAVNDANRVYQDQLIGFGFQNEDLLMKYHEAGDVAKYDVAGTALGIMKAQELEQLKIRETNINKDFDVAQAGIDNAGLRAGLAATKADAAFKTQQARLDTTVKTGQQRSLGQAGRSAEKAVSAMLASYGQSQAALVQSITDAQSKYMLDRHKVAETLRHQAKLTNLKYSNIASELNSAIRDEGYKTTGISLKISQLGEQTKFGREQIQQSIISSGEQYAADQNRITLDKYQADLDASSRMQPVPEAQPQESKPLVIPETVFVDPQRPSQPPKPKKGVNTVPQKGLISYATQVASVVAPFTSDIQLKEDIIPVGTSPSGLPVYEFTYKDKPNQRYQGVMAQDLLNTKYANAVSTRPDGLYQVDYSQLDVEFKKV